MTISKYRLFFILFSLMIMSGLNSIESSASQQRSETIAAVVNEEAITHSDMSRRMRLIIVGSNMPDTQQTREKMAEQVLNSLIDESIRLQEANRLNIKITDDNIKAAFAKLAEQNRMTSEQFVKTLEKAGVDPRTLFAKIKAQLSWELVIQKHLRPQVKVNEQNIKAVIDRLKESAGKTEYRLAEIYLPISNAKEKANVSQLANQLIKQMTNPQNPVPFPAIAHQFSQSATAANGGIKGWVIEDTLPPEHLSALEDIQTGEFTKPIYTEDGYTILALLEKRKVQAPVEENDTIVSVTNLTVSGKNVKKYSEKLSKEIKGCLSIREIAHNDPQNLSIESMDNIRVGSLSKEIRNIVMELDIGEISNPIVTGEHKISLYMLCSKSSPKNQGLNEDKIAERLGLKRLNALQQRYFRDLKVTAFIEKRI